MKNLGGRRVLAASIAAVALYSAARVSAQELGVQAPSSSSADSVYGSVTTGPPVAAVLPLSLDDAIRRGLQHNLDIVLANQNQRTAAGARLQAINYLLPTVAWQAERSRNQINLATQGFRRSLLASFPPGFLPPSAIANFQPLVTVNVVSAQATVKQTLFDLRSYELYRAAQQEIRGVGFAFQSARGMVIQTVAGSYLLALADASNVANAQGLLATNAEILRQAKLEHEAGIATNLDELRARVEYQRQQQAVIARQNAFEKAKVALNREIGLPADQAIRLTDETPYTALEVMPLDQALRQAYVNRQEYQRLKTKLRSAELQSRAARFERLPTLTFDGNYGVVGTVGGVYHGVFLAQGTLRVPIFREAKFRGDRDVADAATSEAMSQLANFRSRIEAEIRDSMLDVGATEQLVKVARSNVDLAQSSLNDTTDRFRNGIADDLPVVEAQATLATAEAQLVSSLYEYNIAKLGLARSVGVIDREYRAYLGTSYLGASLPGTSTGANASPSAGISRSARARSFTALERPFTPAE